jgi:glycosyltransferase involved in cell wall biosynthesis
VRIDVILLVLDEIEGLKVTVPRIPRHRFHRVFAIDGGSSDGSVEYLREQGIRVLGQSRRGRGEAFRLGVASSEADGFAFFSPDGNEDPGDLGRLADHLEEGADLVIASRMMEGAVNEEDDQLLKPRRWVNNAFNLALNLVFNRRPRDAFITDSINGYRGFRRTALPAIEPFPEDYTVEYRMTARALRAGLNIVEFPTHEGQRIGGVSKVPSLQAGLRFIRAFAQELWAGLRGRKPSMDRSP